MLHCCLSALSLCSARWSGLRRTGDGDESVKGMSVGNTHRAHEEHTALTFLEASSSSDRQVVESSPLQRGLVLQRWMGWSNPLVSCQSASAEKPSPQSSCNVLDV
ncbi:hypothetical protein BS78_05G011900 [Paspalum vaginatum]|nr:hypothetical protein BS78_05G011900 [Paspalum vaginatum]